MNRLLILALAVAAGLVVIRYRETQRYALPPESNCPCGCCCALSGVDVIDMDEFDAEFGPTT